MKKWQRGEIATAITIGTLIILGVTSLVSSVFLNKNKQTTKTRAAEACSEEGAWKTSCLEPRERQSCADNAGVALVSRCEGGEWKAQNPECQTQCSPGTQSKGDEWKECNPGEILDQCARKDCDGSRNELVCVEKYCDSSGNIREKSGSPTGQKCEEREDFKSGQQRGCAVGSIVNYCVKEECDTAIGKMVCYESYYDETCELKTRIGSETNTRCGRTEGLQRPPPPPPPTATPWPKNPPLPPSAKKQSENNSVSSNCNYNGKAISNGNIVCAGIGYYYCNNGILVGDGIDERNVPIPYSCGSGKRCSYDVGKEKDQCLDVKSDTGAGQSSEDEQIISTGGGGPEGPQVKYYTESCTRDGVAGTRFIKEVNEKGLPTKKYCKKVGSTPVGDVKYSTNCIDGWWLGTYTCWKPDEINPPPPAPPTTDPKADPNWGTEGYRCLTTFSNCRVEEGYECRDGSCTKPPPTPKPAPMINVRVYLTTTQACGNNFYPYAADLVSVNTPRLGENMKTGGRNKSFTFNTLFPYTGPISFQAVGYFKGRYGNGEVVDVHDSQWIEITSPDQNDIAFEITKDCRN